MNCPICQKQNKKPVIDLWELLKFKHTVDPEEIKEFNTKEITSRIRTHLKKQFPFLKFSVRFHTNRGISDDIFIELTETPFNEERSTIEYHIQQYCELLTLEYYNASLYKNTPIINFDITISHDDAKRTIMTREMFIASELYRLKSRLSDADKECEDKGTYSKYW